MVYNEFRCFDVSLNIMTSSANGPSSAITMMRESGSVETEPMWVSRVFSDLIIPILRTSH